MAKPLIAVIEDDPSAAEALTLILQDWGAEVLVADDAREVERMLGTRGYQLQWIITDFDLGDREDGVSGAQRLLKLAPQARVLVLSGSFRGRGISAARKAGFQLMPKPAQAKAIVGWLERR